MFKSILLIIGRTLLILVAAGIIIGLASGFSTLLGGQGRFRPEGGDNQRFVPQSGGANNGQFARPPRGGDEEGFRENGSLVGGVIQLLVRAVVIGIFTWLGVLVLGFFKSQRKTGPSADQI